MTTSTNPFSVLNGELPAPARAEERAAFAQVEERARILAKHDEEHANLEHFVMVEAERMTAGDMKAAAEKDVAVSEAFDKRSTEMGFMKKIRAVFGTADDVEARRLVVTAAPAALARSRERRKPLHEDLLNAQAKHRKVCEEILAGIVSVRLGEWMPLLTRDGFPPAVPGQAERAGNGILPVVPGPLHEIMRELANAPMEHARFPQLEEQARARLAELGFVLDTSA